uniref:Uncharacterized protein n=1 Tax=Hyaloperonospora arabidopsidis (strain Emoy2) TaxID=559515 RepID=M4B5R3_HYAAE
MILNLSLLELLLLPPVLLLVSGLALFNFQNVFRFLALNLKSYMTIPAVQVLKPCKLLVEKDKSRLVAVLLLLLFLIIDGDITDADKLRYALEQVLGKAASFKFNVSHVLMMAVVIMLMAVFEAIQKNNQLQEQQLKLRQKSKRA